ncbi:MAG: hypothetical protein KDK36_01750 [Leptospiraceae bacterium]|nr:hypothetical protein [Leptospiraceae bacterium]
MNANFITKFGWKIYLILFFPFLSNCQMYIYCTKEFDFNECMESSYISLINGYNSGSRMELVILPVLVKYNSCQQEKREYNNACSPK